MTGLTIFGPRKTIGIYPTIWRKKILSIAQDEQAGDYRHYLISYELERLWARAQQQLVDNQRSRSGLRGWVARKLEL
jgi:hypothetical protein